MWVWVLPKFQGKFQKCYSQNIPLSGRNTIVDILATGHISSCLFPVPNLPRAIERQSSYLEVSFGEKGKSGLPRIAWDAHTLLQEHGELKLEDVRTMCRKAT